MDTGGTMISDNREGKKDTVAEKDKAKKNNLGSLGKPPVL